MKLSHFFHHLGMIAFGVFFLQSGAVGQGLYKLVIDKPAFNELPSPNLGGNTGKKSFKPKDWLEIEVKFKIEVPAAQKNKEKFVDSVTIQWYVAVKDSGKSRRFLLLEKTVDHVGVPIGEDVYTSIYLSPAALRRITDSNTASKRDIENVGGKILVNGKPAHKKSGIFTMKSKPGWWESDKLSRNDKIQLRNKNETPFKFLWYDRYAEIGLAE